MRTGRMSSTEPFSLCLRIASRAFTALVVGEEVDVQTFAWAGAPHEIVALCRRKGRTYRVSVTALQWVGRRPAGAEWLDAYRAWLKGTNGT
jgi:hypothetical protein